MFFEVYTNQRDEGDEDDAVAQALCNTERQHQLPVCFHKRRCKDSEELEDTANAEQDSEVAGVHQPARKRPNQVEKAELK